MIPAGLQGKFPTGEGLVAAPGLWDLREFQPMGLLHDQNLFDGGFLLCLVGFQMFQFYSAVLKFTLPNVLVPGLGTPGLMAFAEVS